MEHDHRHILAVAVGNTRTRFGIFHGRELADSGVEPNDTPEAIVGGITRMAESAPGAAVAMASVNPPMAEKLTALLDNAGLRVLRIGRDIPITLRHTLDDDSTVGQDRLLNALGAYARAQQACVVIDVGTAVTVDFVDGEGIFHGGVIAPGVRMMLRALHEQTASLPSIEFVSPDMARGPFGKDTKHAMILGVQNMVQGLARIMIERYAEHYEAYPQVVATGGDAGPILSSDPTIEHIVPDLQLIGLAEACLAALESEDDDGVEE